MFYSVCKTYLRILQNLLYTGYALDKLTGLSTNTQIILSICGFLPKFSSCVQIYDVWTWAIFMTLYKLYWFSNPDDERHLDYHIWTIILVKFRKDSSSIKFLVQACPIRSRNGEKIRTLINLTLSIFGSRLAIHSWKHLRIKIMFSGLLFLFTRRWVSILSYPGQSWMTPLYSCIKKLTLQYDGYC